MKIVNYLDKQAWRDFIDRHPDANIFHTPEMFQVFSTAHGHEPSLWAAVGEDTQPLALLLPVSVTLKNGLFYPWTTRAVAYGGILCAQDKPSAEPLEALIKAYSRSMNRKILFTELRNMSPTMDIQPALQRSNFQYEDHLDYLVDLDLPEDQLWRNMTKSCRQRIRIAKEKGAVIDEVTNYEQLLAAYRFLQDLYSRVRVPLASFSLFQAAFDICAPSGMCKVFLCRAGSKYIGCAFNLMYNGKILAWYSASDRSYAEYNPGEYLKWHVFLWGKANGYHIFDFGGAGKPNEVYGPREFKAKFGGEQVNYGRNTCIHSPLRLEVSKYAYSIARKVSAFSS